MKRCLAALLLIVFVAACQSPLPTGPSVSVRMNEGIGSLEEPAPEPCNEEPCDLPPGYQACQHVLEIFLAGGASPQAYEHTCRR